MQGKVTEFEQRSFLFRFIYCLLSPNPQGTRNFNTARDRWWFVAVSNCNSTNGLRMNYRFLMTNGERHDLLHYHFSAGLLSNNIFLHKVASFPHKALRFTNNDSGRLINFQHRLKAKQNIYLEVFFYRSDNCLIFSTDEFYIMPVLIAFTLTQFGILFVTIWFAINLKARQLYHTSYKIFLAAVFLHVRKIIRL